MFFLATLIFFLFGLKFPIDFNQTQARFTSLVNLGIWEGEKKRKKKKRRFCQAGFPKFS